MELSTQSSYLRLAPGEIALRAKEAVARLEDCTVCAQNCHVDRLHGKKGFCRGGRQAMVSSYGPHFGEEDVLVGRKGSGTMFFAFCNLACVFCQNYDISCLGEGEELSADELAAVMLTLQRKGCHNVNLVSPSHFVPQIIEALAVAIDKGLKIPIVYNTGGYDSLETLKLLDGIIDIYMPDLKFADDETGKKYSAAPGYFTVASRAIKEMYRQVGDLQTDPDGVAYRGLLVRHLVMPGNLARTEKIMAFLSGEISPTTFVNIMGQYYPAHQAGNYPEIARRVSRDELRQAFDTAHIAGLFRIYI